MLQYENTRRLGFRVAGEPFLLHVTLQKFVRSPNSLLSTYNPNWGDHEQEMVSTLDH